jgi:multicomponent Na+:H+ antiporter subunit B
VNRSVRGVLVLVAGGALAVLFVLAVVHLPAFGGHVHPYRDHAVAAAVARHSANVVGSLNFDQRALDTLVEETILLASVMGVSLLLRPADDETEQGLLVDARVLDSTQLTGYVLLPVTVLVGLDVIAHGHLTPGGGFQGGVIVGTGIHLLYVAARYRALRELRPVPAFEAGEAVGSAAFACLGVGGLVASGAFLSQFVDTGTFGNLFSAGTVPLLNAAVGIEVASAVMVLLAKFLEQAIVIKAAS